MLNSDFENKVRQQMAELNIGVSDAVWDNIERELPPQNKRRRRVLYFFLLALLIAGSLATFYNMRPDSKQIGKIREEQLKPNNTENDQDQKEEPGSLPGPTSQLNKVSAGKTNLAGNRRRNSLSIVQPGAKISDDNAGITSSHKRRSPRTKTPAKSQAILLPAQATADEIVSTAPVAASHDHENERRKNQQHAENSGMVSRHSVAGLPIRIVPQSHFPDSIFFTHRPELEITLSANQLSKNDSVIPSTGSNKASKSMPAKWPISFIVGGGRSNLVNGLFQNKPLADAIGNTSSSPGTGSGITVVPNGPSASAAFAAGIQLERSIGRKWKFMSGLQYQLQTSVVKTGSRVDSAANFYINNNNLLADYFYRPGGNKSYRNKTHFLHVPLLFQYSFIKKYPIHLEAGPGISYLLNSNLLLYSSSRSAWFSSPEAYSKLLLSFTAGAAVDLNRDKAFPFRMGYRFSYYTSSLTKPGFGNQHPQSSMLYFSVPVKK